MLLRSKVGPRRCGPHVTLKAICDVGNTALAIVHPARNIRTCPPVMCGEGDLSLPGTAHSPPVQVNIFATSGSTSRPAGFTSGNRGLRRDPFARLFAQRQRLGGRPRSRPRPCRDAHEFPDTETRSRRSGRPIGPGVPGGPSSLEPAGSLGSPRLPARIRYASPFLEYSPVG